MFIKDVPSISLHLKKFQIFFLQQFDFIMHSAHLCRVEWNKREPKNNMTTPFCKQFALFEIVDSPNDLFYFAAPMQQP